MNQNKQGDFEICKIVLIDFVKINKALLTTSLQGNDLLIKIQFKDVHVFPFDLKFNVSFPEKS